MTESRRRRLGHHSDPGRGMTLPFQPLNLAFSHMYYSVDMPPVWPHLIMGQVRALRISLSYMHACVILLCTCDWTHSLCTAELACPR